jgi:pimeloyl-ACP methyl ester carboxylesterase
LAYLSTVFCVICLEKNILPPPLDDDERERLKTYVEHFHIQPKGFDHIMKALCEFEFGDSFRDKLNIETHLVVGKNDVKCPKVEVNVIKDALGDNCKVKEFEDSGHNIVMENPEDFVALVDSVCGNSGL